MKLLLAWDLRAVHGVPGAEGQEAPDEHELAWRTRSGLSSGEGKQDIRLALLEA